MLNIIFNAKNDISIIIKISLLRVTIML